MDTGLHEQVSHISMQPGVEGVLLADNQGFTLVSTGIAAYGHAPFVTSLMSKVNKLGNALNAGDALMVSIEMDSK